MRRSKVEFYAHLVWSTAHRQPFITSNIERRVHRCIEAEVKKLGCAVLAINGMPDHLHLAIQLPSTVTVAKVAQIAKGASSRWINDEICPVERFDWQNNYAAFSISRSHLKQVIVYIQQQKIHHAANTIWLEWEETDEEAL
jgi:REP element-mobilizing transposase RayT